MTTTRTSLTALGLTAAVLITSGCGSSKSLSRDELIAKADPICQRANEKLDSSKINPQNVGQLAPGIAAVEHQVSDELAKLTPPAPMAADWKVIVNGFRRAGVGLEKVGQAARASKKVTRLFAEGEAELNSGQHDRAITAARNGFNDCHKY